MNGDIEDKTREPTRHTQGSALALLVIDEGRCERHRLPARGMITVGRGDGADIRVRQPWISRRHVILRLSESSLTVEDAGSSYGTALGGNALAPGVPCPLREGDVLELGSTMLVVQRHDARETSSRHAVLGAEITDHELVDLLRQDADRAARLGLALDLVSVDGASTALVDALSHTASLARLVRSGDRMFAIALRPANAASLGRHASEALAGRGISTPIGEATARAGERSEDLVRRAIRAAASLGDHALVFADPSMDRVRRDLELLAASDVSVLFEGETGTGKTSLARLVHALSPRREVPLVRVACARLAIPGVDDELFEWLAGLTAEAARATTLLLDEIDDAPIESQARLAAEIPDGVRVISTARDLAACPDFRRDLFFRIAGSRIGVPALRDRPRDIDALAARFLGEAAVRAQKPRALTIGASLADALRDHPWPGNVRELRDALVEATLLAEGSSLGLADVPRLGGSSKSHLRAQLASLEHHRIVDALERCGGNQSQAARALGMPRNTLLARIREYGLPQPRKDRMRRDSDQGVRASSEASSELHRGGATTVARASIRR